MKHLFEHLITFRTIETKLAPIPVAELAAADAADEADDPLFLLAEESVLRP